MMNALIKKNKSQLNIQQSSVQTMSMKGSSIGGNSENPEVKYKKALKQISKLINANKVIREESEDVRRTMQNQMNQFAIRYNDLEKDYHQLKKEHESMEKYLEELQESNSELQREHHTVEKELAYLNEMLAEQNLELKKVQAIKDQKKISQLIRTYEEKEQLYMAERNSHEELIRKLREEQGQLEFEVSQERTVREEAEDKFELMRGDINQYRQINKMLIEKNENAYKEYSNKEGVTREKEREIQGLVQEFRKQITGLRTAKQSATDTIGAQYESNYEMILDEKNKVLADFVQLKEQYETAQNKIREMYDLEERMKFSVARAQALSEECNMLKSKIVVLESREVMDDGGDFDFNHKQFDDKITHLLSQGDPLIGIKNSDEMSHFKILKAYIVELREKLEKGHAERKEYHKKYKSIAGKFSRLVEESANYEEDNKFLRGKVEGFEKLTEKLQNQFEKNMMIYESQVTKMSSSAKEAMDRKNQELGTSMKFMREQIEQIQDRSSRTEKNLLQEVEFLKLEVSTHAIRNEELDEKVTETNEFITIYKKNLAERTEQVTDLEDKHSEVCQQKIKYEQLFKDEKSKSEILATQKNQLTNKLFESGEELDRKTASYEEQAKGKTDSYNGQIKKYRADNSKLETEIDNLKKELVINRRDFEEKKHRDGNEIEQVKKELSFFKDIEQQHSYQKQKNRDLETQNETLKIKNSKYSSEHEKAAQFEEQLMRKNDESNDLKRKMINIESALNVAESDLKDENSQNETLRKENAKLRMKLLESGQEIRKQFDGKDQDARQTILKLNQEISELNLQLNEQRSKTSRVNTDYHRYKAEKQRLEQLCEELRDKDTRNSDNVASMKIRIQQTIEEIEKNKAENRMLQLSVKRLNDQLDNMQIGYNSLRQEHSTIRIREQEAETSKNQVLKELEGLKFYFPDVEEFIKKMRLQSDLSWEAQKARDNMNEIIMRLKRTMKLGEGIDSRTNIGSSYGINVAGISSMSKVNSGVNVLTGADNTRKTFTSDSMMLGEARSANTYQVEAGSTGQYTSKEFFAGYAELNTKN